jgi:hypothetical protein
MRGPGLKLDLDVRRLWTCPVCHQQRRLPGDIASPLCPCRDGGVIMQLTADSRLLRRAERLTPLPYLKHAVSAPVEQHPVEQALEEQPSPARNEEAPVDDFGGEIDLPPEPPAESAEG